jgi:hypothetical protein
VNARLVAPHSHAVTALVLMALEAEPGRWLTLPHLVAKVWASEDVVRNHLELLAQAGGVTVRRCDHGLIEAARMGPATSPSGIPKVLTPQRPALGGTGMDWDAPGAVISPLSALYFLDSAGSTESAATFQPE